MKKALSFFIAFTIFISVMSCLALSASAQELPSSYNSDLNNLQYVSSVKSQGTYGNCWAFATVACCEAEAIKNHGADPDAIDLSELHLSYFAYNGERVGTGDKTYTSGDFYNNGGYYELSIFTLSNWIGLVDESVAEYSSLMENPNLTLDSSLIYADIEYYLENAYTYSASDNIATIKEAIMQYGAVQTSYYSDDSFLNQQTYAHYCKYTTDADHAITIVGWDDNFSKYNFKSGSRPSSNGAWLVKNSWGEDWGLNGYFWLSYEDKTITDITAFDVTPAQEMIYKNNYQYDGGVASVYSTSDSLSIATVFTAKSNEELLAISAIVKVKDDPKYNLEIYVNPEKLGATDFKSGELVHSQSGSFRHSGFNKIELTSSVALDENDIFIICITTKASIAFDMSQDINDNNGKAFAHSVSTTKKDQTYVSVNDTGFYDISDPEQESPMNARIKAYTNDITLGEAVFVSLPAMKAIEYGQQLKNAELVGGEIVDSISGKKIRGVWSFASPDARVSNKEPVKIIFTPNNSAYNVIEKSIEASVLPSTPDIEILLNTDSYMAGDKILITAIASNQYTGEQITSGSFYCTYSINGGEAIPFTDGFYLPDDISGLSVKIKAIFSDNSGLYESGEREVTIEAESTPEKNDPLYPERNNDLPYTKISCGASISISVILSVSALAATALLKKRKRD